MRKLAIALAAGGIAAIGFAAPAQADLVPGGNWTYGHCVTSGYANPSNGSLGPMNPHQPYTDPDAKNVKGKPTGAARSSDASGGKSHFDGGIVCPKA